MRACVGVFCGSNLNSSIVLERLLSSLYMNVFMFTCIVCICWCTLCIRKIINIQLSSYDEFNDLRPMSKFECVCMTYRVESVRPISIRCSLVNAYTYTKRNRGKAYILYIACAMTSLLVSNSCIFEKDTVMG